MHDSKRHQGAADHNGTNSTGLSGNVADRRVRRTQESLRNALLELILEKGFEATTISEITERANVGRSTFYAHYADKEDLLQGSVAGLQQYLQGHVDAAACSADPDVHPALAFCLPMLEHADGNREVFSAMVGRRSGYLFQELCHDMWADFVRTNWRDADEVAVQAIAGGFNALLAWWLDKSPKLKPAQLEKRFRAFIEPTLG